MDKVLISIIMPAYNADKYIGEAILSVIKQTYTNWELIIVDDGSTDSTGTIVSELVEIDGRINYYYQNNGKQGKARNLGIKNSKGNYIAFLDADDLWTEDKLSIQMDTMKANREIDLIFSQGYSLNNNKTTDFNLNVKEVWDINDFGQFIYHNQIPILSVLVKKEALITVNNFTEKPEIQNVEDYHLWLKLLINGSKFKSIANRLFYYRIHADQCTFQNKNLDEGMFYVYKDLYEHCACDKVRKPLLMKFKWYIFNDKFSSKCVDFFLNHFKHKNIFIAFIIKKTLLKPLIFNKRIIFKLATSFA